MAKVLLVDTNFSSTPIYDAIAQFGHEVHVVGGNPADALAKICPNYWNFNYSDTEALNALVARENFDFLVPGCTDKSYSACSAVSQGRFPGISSVAVDIALNQKDRFRELAAELGLPVPKLQWQDKAHQGKDVLPNIPELQWPLVIKPVDAYSGKGVSILLSADPAALLQAVRNARLASARGYCLIEDYIAGQLHSHSAFLASGKVVHDVFVEEHGTANPFVVDTSRVIPQVTPILRMQLRKSIDALANELKLVDGLVHTQFILRDGQPWLIELTRRCPGDHYSQLVELSGVKGYVENYVRPFLGMPIQVLPAEAHSPILRHTVTVPSTQRFSHLRFHQELLVERWIPLCLTGEYLKPSPESRIGIMFVKATDTSQLSQLIAATLARQLYDVVP